MRKKAQISFLIVVMYVFSLIMNTASVFASSVSGSSGSVPSGGGSRVSSGLSHLGTPVFRVGLTRDSGTYHNGTSASKVKVANNFSYRYPNIEKELFFVPHSVRSYYPSYGVLLYDNSSRKSNKFDLSSSPVYKSVLFMNNVSSSPGNKAKQALANYTFIDVSSSKYIGKLEKGVWKKQVSGITRQDALNFWSYVFKDVDNIRERFESLVSSHADKYGSSLSNNQKDDIAKGYLGALIMAWVLAPSEYKAYWESGIEDFITQRDIRNKPVSFVFDTAMTLFFEGSSKRFIMPTIDFFEHYTSLSKAWDIEGMTKEKLGGSYDTYELLKRVVTKDIGSYPKISRISDNYIAGNAFAAGAGAIVYPKKRFSTRPGYGTYFDTNLADAYMDMFSVGSTSDGKKIRGFMVTSYDLNLDTSGCNGTSCDEDKSPDDLTLFLPLKMVVTPKDRVVNAQSEKINEKVKIVFSSSIKGSSLNSVLESFSKAKDKNPSFKIRITIGSRNGAVQPAKYEGSVGGINKDFTLTYDQVISLIKGNTSLTFYDDTINEPISPNTEKKITYSNVSIQLTYKNLEGNTKTNTRNINSDFASFKRPAVPPEPLVYTSKPRTYAEFKEGSPDNESFEAMAGVPSTKRLYLGVGGSEFIVDVEFEYMQNVNSVWRTYRSWFSGTPSEFKDGDNAKTATLGGYTVDLHNGGTYTKTWTGTIPNNGQDVTVNGSGSVTATSVAVPDYSEYNAKKAEAQQYVQQVNSTVLSHTSASDKKTRTYKNWGASITTDSKNPPQNTTSSNSCYTTDSKGNSIPLPCSTTATKAPDGNFTITVTFTVPAHVICGPECTYDLPPVEDTWKQRINFDYMKIVRAEVFKLEKGRIVGVENVFGEGNNELKASIKSAVEPSIFVNIAQRNANGDDVSAQSSKHGRIRYSLETNQHDKVVWYEGVRSNKSAGEGRNGSSFAPQGGGHNNSWAKGILYTNPNYTTEKDYHRQKVAINTATSNVADSIDVTTPEWRRFDERRKSPVVATIISDMLILQTSSGDQSVFYFDKDSQQVQAQEQFPPLRVSKDEMWKNNNLSPYRWTDDHVYIGSYNGRFGQSGVGSSNNKKYWGYDFEKDMFIDNASGGSRYPIETAFERYGTGVGVDGNTPRPAKPSKLYVWGSRDIVKTTMNGLHENEGAEVFYKELLNWRSPNAYSKYGNFPLQESAYKAENQPNFDNIKGLVFDGLYSDDHDKVNDVVIHTPVSTEKAVVVSLPKSRDQRTELPEGSAESLIDQENQLKICPLDPAKCEFRVLNCKYRHDKELAFFDFENTTPITILNKTTGAYVPYEMSNGMTFVNSPIGGFGQGKVLKATGTRFSLALSDLGVKVDRYERVLVEADVYIPSLTQDMMVFSFYKYDFYLPLALNGQATLNTGNGVEKQILNENFINRVVRLGVEFSLGHIEDTKVYIDGVEVTKFKRVNKSLNSGQVLDLIGDKLNIGSWGANDNYPANFYIDNLKVVKKGGLYNHTESCYIWTESHDTVWNHVHTSSCYPNGDTTKPPICKNLPMNTMTEANVHVHDSSCIYPIEMKSNDPVPVNKPSVDFGYTGTVQQFTAPENGTYLLEVWGAQGGNGGSSGQTYGGKGGYTRGEIYLTAGQTIYVYVGGKGADGGANHYFGNYVWLNGGFNGGGNNYTAGGGGSGGGATDIRVGGTSLANRVIVAGGGGGAGWSYDGGYGGGLNGGSVYDAGGGTQTSGGYRGTMPQATTTGDGTLGQGGIGSGHSGGGGGGGGGYYGGGGSGYAGGGGGGSSYIGGVTNGQTIAGNQSMPSPSGGTEVGHSGHGFARIKQLTSGGGSGVITATPVSFSYSGNIQTYTVPATGTYMIETWGASGGTGYSGYTAGKGAYAVSYVTLNAGETLKVLVGGQGQNYNAGTGSGGGGSFVAKSDNTPLAVAGGGGGAYYNYYSGTYYHGQPTQNVVDFPPYTQSVTTGQGGFAGYNGYSYPSTAGAGGGFYGNGMANSYSGGGSGGYAFVNGGGVGYGYSYGVHGGFGGGGGTAYVGGGGGGYTGGHAGTGYHTYYHTGGGGGSYFTGVGGYAKGGWESMPSPNGGTQVGNVGNGFVKITPQSLQSESISYIEWDFNGTLNGFTNGTGVISSTSTALKNTISHLDNYFYSPTNLGITNISSDTDEIEIRLKNNSSGTEGQIYFTTSAHPTFAESAVLKFTMTPNDSGYKTYRIKPNGHPNWKGTLNQLRFDLANGVTSGEVLVDYIKVNKESSIPRIQGYTLEEIFGPNWENYVKEKTTTVTKTVDGGSPVTFNFKGSVQTYTVPSTGKYKLEVWGAQGGYGGDGNYPNTSWTPGKGGYATGEINLTAGQVLHVYVGGQGNGKPGQYYSSGVISGGWNGGGDAYHDGYEFGGGGGGATDIRLGGTSLNDRIIVAGGGGGTGEDGERGGDGGGNISSNDYNSNYTATQSYAGVRGGFGYGASYASTGESGGGGGGGYYGGGGGEGTGSGGGSGYTGSLSNASMQNGVNIGDGKAVITPLSTTITETVTKYEVDWDKVKVDADKKVFPEYMWDGNINPLFKYCVPSFGDNTSNISIMKNSTRSNAVIETLKYPNTDKDVQVVRFNSGVVAEATSETFNLAKYATYTLTFDAWGIEDGRELTISVVGDSSLVKTFVIDKGVQKRLTFTFRSYLDVSNARIKIRTDGSSGHVYVTNIRLFSQPIYNVHEHTVNCKLVKTLSCTEPHHFGAHYGADSSVCWDACGINENHQIQKKEVVKPDGSVVQAGTFVNLDYGFRVYFPNVGDFAQIPTMHGIPEVTQLRGKGFVNNMDTTEYTLFKYVKFGFDVIYEGKMYKAGSMISLPVNQDYYDFYCSLANAEALGASVEFEVVPINGQPIEDPKNENYEAVTNKERFEDYYSLHGAYKKVYVDVVGRIGNLVVSDTEDLRFSNFFKEPLSADQWIVDGVLKKVNMYKQNKYYGDLVDIRGVPVKDTGVWLNTYGALSWLNKSPHSFPVNARDQSIDVLKEKFLKIGYDIFSDIQTIGSYQDGVIRVLPYYFKLNLDTGEVTPLDAYVKVGGVYQPVNLYKGADGGTLPNNIHKTDIIMDWEEESYRRNFSMDESIITDKVAEYLGEPVTGLVVTDDGTEEGITGYKRLTTPLGRYVKQGYPQRMVIDKKSRTFIGSSKTYGEDKNPGNVIEEIEFNKNAQRWYMKFSLPPSAEFVPAGLPPTQSSFDMVKKGNSVILLTADIVSLGNVYNLRYRQDWVDSITVTKEGVTRVFDIKSANLPPVIAIFDSEGNASIDISIRKSH